MMMVWCVWVLFVGFIYNLKIIGIWGTRTLEGSWEGSQLDKLGEDGRRGGGGGGGESSRRL